jgi:heat-inducible transcriptional repressor
MAISERKQLILKTIIKEYLKTAQPVSSGGLVEGYKLDISPATVRNEMMELEEAGYIHQPHTSAGRIPTALAYDLHAQNILTDKKRKLNEKEQRVLNLALKNDDASRRQVAKIIAELSGGAIFWAFHKNDLYYTGISNLFSQAEFRQFNLVCDVSGVIDRLEEIIAEVFDSLESGQQVLIGEKNPFGNFLSTVIVKYKKDNQTGIFGILGPMRMDYEKNLALVEYLMNNLNKI